MIQATLRTCFALVLGTFTITALLPVPRAKAQSPSPFLVSPYYGTEIKTQGYGPNHQAYDFGLSYERVLAAASGTTDIVDWYNDDCHQYGDDPGETDRQRGLWCGYGLYIRINHGNGYHTIYGHFSTTAFEVGATGHQVELGQIIGTSGSTGWSSGPHLHFEVLHNWVNVDPFNENGVSLWVDGQWANPSRPIPEPANGGEIIVDDNPDNNNGFSKGRGGPFNNPCTGSGCPYWYRATGSGLGAYGDDMYWTYDNDNTPDYWARWQPSLFGGNSGIYEVYVHVASYNGTTWQAPYTVVHTLGQTQATVDQLGLYNQWVSIGTYQFDPGLGYVYTVDATGETNAVRQLGVDAVKFVRRGTTYQPDVRTSGGWSSSLSIRSNGGTARTRVTFLDSNGNFKGASTLNIVAHASSTFQAPTGATSAVVDASQDVAVVVVTDDGGQAYAYNGIAASDGLNPGWGQTGTELYAPVIMNDY